MPRVGDEEGNLFITDPLGAQDPDRRAKGRLVSIDSGTTAATVQARDSCPERHFLYTRGFDGLWVGHNTANRIDSGSRACMQ